MRGLICLVLGLACPGVAQPPVWSTVFTNIAATGVSSNVKNSGQTQHLLYGTASSNSPATCANLNVNVMRLEGSYDNVTFNAISINEVSDSAGNWTIYGNGSYPFIRARIVYLDGGGSNCKVNAFYSGTFPTVPLQGAIPSKAWGQQIKLGTIATATNAQLIGGGGGLASNSKWLVNFIDITTYGVATIILQEYTDNTCTVSIGAVLYLFNATASGASKQFPYTDVGYWKGTQNNSALCLSSSAAVLTHTLVKYRYEE